ncbi:MAG: 3-methyl-2-oxobutanoate hydroxymethyltransferase [Betaproteobacteria bacterium]|nr:3-methyl-2-oxobutanoate hydroxymethyltransferase [Betaproteobacteria bacterium]
MSVHSTSSEDVSGRKPVTVPGLAAMRARGERIAMLTCYDAAFAAVLDAAGVDVLLIGDSLGMVLQGHSSTLPVTLQDVAYHTACVSRAKPKALVMADMPWASYQASCEQAYGNAAALMAAGAQMVKLEGGAWLVPTVEFLVSRGIPVCAHLGLTPQSLNVLGGYKVQGRGEAGEQLLADARAMQEAGAGLVLVELIPSTLGKALTEALSVPTIGIGAGPHTSGQVLVLHDILDVAPGKKARFVKNYLAGSGSIQEAVANFVREVKSGAYPQAEHGFLD